MLRAQGFCDLNIPFTRDEWETRNIVLKALSMGYQTVAINHHVVGPRKPEDYQGKSKKKKQKESDVFPKPVKIEFSESELKKNNITRKPVILNRVTITHSNPASPFLTKNSRTIKEFDLVAIIPENDGALKQIVGTCMVNTDIISLNAYASSSLLFLSRNLLKSAVEKDMYFEICYSPCLVDVKARKYAIAMSHSLHRINRSANIIISSEARSIQQLRSPYDAMNFGRILSLSEFAAKSAVVNSAHNVLYCAMARRMGMAKCAAQVTLLDGESEDVRFEGLGDASEFLIKTKKPKKRKRKDTVSSVEDEVKKKKKKASVTSVDGEVKKKKKKASVTSVDGEVEKEKKKVTVTSIDGEVKKRKKATVTSVDGEEEEEKKKVTVTSVGGELEKEATVTSVDGETEREKKEATVSGVDGEVEKKKNDGQVKKKKKIATVSSVDGPVKKKKKMVSVTSVDGEVENEKKEATVSGVDGEVEKKKKKATINGVDGQVKKKKKIATVSGVDGPVKKKKKKTTDTSEVPTKKVVSKKIKKVVSKKIKKVKTNAPGKIVKQKKNGMTAKVKKKTSGGE